MGQLTQLVYVSNETVNYDQQKLIELQELARRENLAHQVTGLLLYHDGCFMQVIEGAKPDIDQIYSNICRDKTHKNVLCLYNMPVYQRDFADWSMGFKHITGPKPDGFSNFLNADGETSIPSSQARTLLLSFKQTHGVGH